jgi:hypothetical protein
VEQQYYLVHIPTPGSETTYSFVLRAVDAASNTSSRSFSITARPPTQESFTTSGTFSVPSGISSLSEVLVIAGGGGGGSPSGGGGGGAGGLIYMPCYPVTASGTITVTVGDGGPAPGNYPGGVPGARGTSGQDSVFGTLTAKGGGAGGGNISSCRPGVPGGSGGGGAAPGAASTAGSG